MELKIDKEKLDAMMAAVGEELEQMLAKSAVDDDPGETSSGSGSPVEPDASADAAPAAEESAPAPEASVAPEAPAPEASPEQPVAASPEGAPDMGGEAIEPAPTVEALQAEYAKLDVEALKMHYLAAKSALVAAMGNQAAPAAPAPEASAPAPVAAAPAAPAPDAFGKSEAYKSQQAELKALKKALEDQKADFEAKLEKKLIEATTKATEDSDKAIMDLVNVLSTPVRKAATKISDIKFLGKNGDNNEGNKEPLTKAQIKARLSTLIQGGTLSKSDKDKIAQYSVTQDISKIEHLLVEAAK